MTEAEQNNLESLLWSTNEGEITLAFEAFKTKYKLKFERHSMFPVHNEFLPSVGDETQSKLQRVLSKAIKNMTLGFTSSEKKLNDLV